MELKVPIVLPIGADPPSFTWQCSSKKAGNVSVPALRQPAASLVLWRKNRTDFESHFPFGCILRGNCWSDGFGVDGAELEPERKREIDLLRSEFEMGRNITAPAFSIGPSLSLLPPSPPTPLTIFAPAFDDDLVQKG